MTREEFAALGGRPTITMPTVKQVDSNENQDSNSTIVVAMTTKEKLQRGWSYGRWVVLAAFIYFVLIGLPLWNGVFYSIYLAARGSSSQNACSCGYRNIETGQVWMEFINQPQVRTNDFFNSLVQTVGTEERGYYKLTPENTIFTQDGVDLIVDPPTSDPRIINGGGLRTIRKDIRYGSFEITAKFPSGNGTCAAFFLYESDDNEIDFEYVGFRQKLFAGVQTTDKENQLSDPEVWNSLDMASSDQTRTLRMDWDPTEVRFSLDGRQIHKAIKSVPTVGSFLFLSHWTQFKSGWTLGVPSKRETFSVGRFQAFFNSSDEGIVKERESRCKDVPLCDAKLG